jgi:hypothetical protein
MPGLCNRRLGAAAIAAPANICTATGTFALPAPWSDDALGCETAHPVLPVLSTVPAVVGDRVTAAGTALTGAGLRVGAISTVVDCNSLGIVRGQNPAAGQTVAAGSPVNLTVGKAPTPPAGCP